MVGEYPLMREVRPIGYTIEATRGTDPGGVRLPFLGIIESAKYKVDEHRSAYYGVGAATTPTGFRREGRDITFDMTMLLQDDNPANSLLSLFLGDAPNGTTGTITLRPNTTNNNLRSITIEAGYDTAGTDRYCCIKGCLGEKFELSLEENLVKLTTSWIVDDVTNSDTYTGTAPPSLSTLRPFDGCNDSTWTFANPTISTYDLKTAKFIGENKIETGGKLGAGRTKKYGQIVGRKVFCELDVRRLFSTWETAYLADPSTTTAEQDITCVLSKNTAAEYLSIALTDCQIVDPISVGYDDKEDVMVDKYRFQAKGYTFDDKA